MFNKLKGKLGKAPEDLGKKEQKRKNQEQERKNQEQQSYFNLQPPYYMSLLNSKSDELYLSEHRTWDAIDCLLSEQEQYSFEYSVQYDENFLIWLRQVKMTLETAEWSPYASSQQPAAPPPGHAGPSSWQTSSGRRRPKSHASYSAAILADPVLDNWYSNQSAGGPANVPSTQLSVYNPEEPSSPVEYEIQSAAALDLIMSRPSYDKHPHDLIEDDFPDEVQDRNLEAIYGIGSSAHNNLAAYSTAAQTQPSGFHEDFPGSLRDTYEQWLRYANTQGISESKRKRWVVKQLITQPRERFTDDEWNWLVRQRTNLDQ